MLSSAALLLEHVNLGFQPSTPAMDFACGTCSKTFTENRALLQHMNYCSAAASACPPPSLPSPPSHSLNVQQKTNADIEEQDTFALALARTAADDDDDDTVETHLPCSPQLLSLEGERPSSLRVGISWLCGITLTKHKDAAAAAATNTTSGNSVNSSCENASSSSFLGLFTMSKFALGQLVCVYRGKELRTAEALRLQDKSYLMRLGEQCYVDARETPEILARYINDCINPAGYNVKFEKDAFNKCAQVVALRDIEAGEELFVDYGKWYWKGAAVIPTRISFSDLVKLKANLVI